MRKHLMPMMAALLTLVLIACPNNPSPDFALSLEPKSLTLDQGNSGSVTLTLDRQGDFAEAVTVTVSGLPTGVTTDALTIAESSSSGTLTLRAASDATTGDSSLTVTGTSGTLSHSATLQLTVNAVPDFSLSLSSSTLTLSRNGSGSVYVSVNRQGGFTASVAVTVSGLPNEVSAQPLTIYNPNTGGTLMLSASSNATLGDADATVTGTAGNFNHSAMLKLTVIEKPASGSLDSGFDQDGRVITDVDNNYDQVYALALQSDGKIIAAGISRVGTNTTTFDNEDFSVVRYNPDGSLDTTFDGDGKVTIDFGGREQANAVVIQPDGKIVVAGWTWNTTTEADFALVRYTANGSLDTSFDSDGKVTTDFGDNDSAWCMVLQPDGKIVLAGSKGASLILARYNANGSLDTSFGGTGKVTFTGALGWARAMSLQSDGKIVLAGLIYNPEGDFGLVRYNPDGGLDTSFDTDGWLTTDMGGKNDEAYAVTLQSDGKIIAAGRKYTINSPTDFALARYNSDGSLDTSFDTDGKLTTDFGDTEEALAVAVQPDGKIVAAGFKGPYPCDFALARYNPNGSLDTSFGTGGKVSTDTTSGNDLGNAMILQPDGKIVVAGFGNGDFGLTRYWP